MATLNDYKKIKNRQVYDNLNATGVSPQEAVKQEVYNSAKNMGGNFRNTLDTMFSKFINNQPTQPEPTQPETGGTGGTTKTPSKWEEYQSAIKSYEANAQADLASIQQQTNKYMQNYLAQYGLAGSGAGQTAMVQNANNMANINQDMLRQNQASSMAYRQGLQEDAMNQIQKRIESGAYDSIQLQDYINQMAQDNGIDASTIQNMRDEVKMAGIDWVEERDDYIKKIDEAMAQTSNPSSRAELQALRDQLNNGKLTQEEFNDIVSNSELLNSNIGLTEQLAQNAKSQTIENFVETARDKDLANDIKYAVEKGKKIDANDDPIEVDKELDHLGSGDPSDDQNKFVTAVMEAVKYGRLANGTLVDLNYGARWDEGDVYVVFNGALYKTKSNYDGKYKKYNVLESGNMEKFGISI